MRADPGAPLLRFVGGRPASQVAEDFLARVRDRRAAEGRKALLLVWGNASRHNGRRVRAWTRAHDRRAKQEGGVRPLACYLPTESPWLDPIEPTWARGKRAIAEPDRLLAAGAVRARVCGSYGCEHPEPLAELSARNCTGILLITFRFLYS